MLCRWPRSTIGLFTAEWDIQANDGSFGGFHPSFRRYRRLNVYKIIKIHPGSTLCDKKVPAIIYDELVSSRLFPLFTVNMHDAGLHKPDLCERRILRSK